MKNTTKRRRTAKDVARTAPTAVANDVDMRVARRGSTRIELDRPTGRAGSSAER
jgi:hypothetical protein